MDRHYANLEPFCLIFSHALGHAWAALTALVAPWQLRRWLSAYPVQGFSPRQLISNDPKESLFNQGKDRLSSHATLITLTNRTAPKQQLKWQIGSVDGPTHPMFVRP
jgi:hypothetical protein